MFTQLPLVVIGTLGMAMLLVSMLYAIRLLHVLVVSRGWQSFTARLLSLSVTHRTVRDRTLRGAEFAREIPLSVNVDYVFEREGQQIHGRAINLADLVSEGLSLDRKDIRALTSLKSVDGPISVWVDPKRPDRAVIYRRIPLAAMVILLLAFAASLTAVLSSASELIYIPYRIAYSSLITSALRPSA